MSSFNIDTILFGVIVWSGIIIVDILLSSIYIKGRRLYKRERSEWGDGGSFSGGDGCDCGCDCGSDCDCDD